MQCLHVPTARQRSAHAGMSGSAAWHPLHASQALLASAPPIELDLRSIEPTHAYRELDWDAVLFYVDSFLKTNGGFKLDEIGNYHFIGFPVANSFQISIANQHASITVSCNCGKNAQDDLQQVVNAWKTGLASSVTEETASKVLSSSIHIQMQGHTCPTIKLTDVHHRHMVQLP